MKKGKRKLTAAERAAKKRRRQECETIFINGKQKRVRRQPTIEGMDAEEFILRNADPIWLQQNEMWEYLTPEFAESKNPESSQKAALEASNSANPENEQDLPF
ncbi:MAG: hypothetical protein NTX50_04425 [Candidatus Sumerlaeota bacterium]|nr:hypothetical protein [Candidatus Sumerlaeota bacterium]